MQRWKNKVILSCAVVGAVVILVAVAAVSQSKPDKKKNNPATVSSEENTKKTMEEIEKIAKTEKKVLQKLDGDEKKSPVKVNTDGTVKIDKLKGYKEDAKKDEKVSESRIHIKSIGSYSGPYVEDGTDEEVRDVLSIVVTNVSKEFLQYSEITMTNGKDTATFSLSNLPAGSSVLVLAKDRKAAGKDWKYEKDVTAFIKKAEQHEDKFSWEAGDHFLTLSNKGKDKYSKVHVYYKNTQNGIYLGGITYRMGFDNLEAGEARQQLSKHFDGNNSHVMMIDYIN